VNAPPPHTLALGLYNPFSTFALRLLRSRRWALDFREPAVGASRREPWCRIGGSRHRTKRKCDEWARITARQL